MNQTNSSILISILINGTLLSTTFTSSTPINTVDLHNRNYSSFFITSLTNGVLIFFFSICLFPLIYCYKKIHEKLTNIGLLSADRPPNLNDSRNVTSISYSNNEFEDVSESTVKMPPIYDKIEKSINIEGLPSYENYVKSKQKSGWK